MSWLRPIEEAQREATKRKSRAIVIDGVHYRSIYMAQKALECSASKIYRLINEQWRYTKGSK